MKRSTPLKRSKGVRRVNPARKKVARLTQFGTERRVNWFKQQPCACGGRHPACTGGWSDPSHTRSRAVHGDASTIIPQSRGCHDFIHAHGWSAWESELGLDKDELAATYASMGPDQPETR